MPSLGIGWILVGDERVASARLQGWLVHRELVRRGHASSVLNQPGPFDTRLRWKAPRRWREAFLRRRDAVVFQKVDSSRAVRFAALARRAGTKIVVAQADPLASPLYPLAHAVVVSSDELGRALREHGVAESVVIPDALEHPREVVAEGSDRREGLRLVWIGHRFNFPAVERLRREILARVGLRDMELVTVSDHPGADRAWSHEVALDAMRSADVAVIPCEETPATRAKSNNRLTMFMGVGLPVVATPLPAYEAAAVSGETALFARTDDAWEDALVRLRDPALRRRIGAAARRSAWERFAPDLVVGRWESLFLRLVGGDGAADRGRAAPDAARSAP